MEMINGPPPWAKMEVTKLIITIWMGWSEAREHSEGIEFDEPEAIDVVK